MVGSLRRHGVSLTTTRGSCAGIMPQEVVVGTETTVEAVEATVRPAGST